MELLNRYLCAVAARLPERQCEDITAELREDLLSRIEEQEAELRRPLTEREVVALLKSHGHPLVVAASYLRGHHLVSPLLLPFYWFAARVIVGVDLLTHFVYCAVALAFGESVVHVLGTCLQSLWIVTMYLFGVLTFSALIMDRVGAARWLARAWTPRYLPGLRRRRPANAVLALDAVGIVGLALCVSGAIPILQFLAWPIGAHVRANPIWGDLAPFIILLAVALLALHLIERSRLRYRKTLLTAKVVHGGLVILAARILVGARPWLQIFGLAPNVANEFARALNVTIGMGIGVATTLASISIALNSVKLLRALRAVPPLPSAWRHGSQLESNRSTQ